MAFSEKITHPANPQIEELIRIYQSISARKQVELMRFAYELEEDSVDRTTIITSAVSCQLNPEDELLPAAIKAVLDTGQASVSMLQRRLKLGYSRAVRLIEQMEERGYIGPFEGSRPRQILITRAKWMEIQKGTQKGQD